MVTARNSLDKLTAGVSTRANLLTYFNSNLDIIDAAMAKCNFAGGATAPDADNDEGEGYAIGSKWHTDTAIWECTDPTEGAAVWEQTWPALATDMDLSGYATATTKVCGEEASISGTALTIPHTPIANTYRLFKNGVRLKEGSGEGFTRSGANVTLTTAKEAGDWFCQDYEY